MNAPPLWLRRLVRCSPTHMPSMKQRYSHAAMKMSNGLAEDGAAREILCRHMTVSSLMSRMPRMQCAAWLRLTSQALKTNDRNHIRICVLIVITCCCIE